MPTAPSRPPVILTWSPSLSTRLTRKGVPSGTRAIVTEKVRPCYRAHRGDRSGAERLVARADQAVRGSTNPDWQASLATTRVLMALANGQMEKTVEMAMEFAKTMDNPDFRTQILNDAAHAAVALRDVKRMQAAVRELDALPNLGKRMEGCKQTHRPGLALLEGRLDEVPAG